MSRSLSLFMVYLLALGLFLFSCENKQKAEVGQTTAGQIVDASKQTQLAGPFRKEKGFCVVADLPQYTSSADTTSENSKSRLVLYEDGKPIGPAHSMHDDIRTKGMGRYSHWVGEIYFSSSDNSDPNKNGKKYSFSL